MNNPVLYPSDGTVVADLGMIRRILDEQRVRVPRDLRELLKDVVLDPNQIEFLDETPMTGVLSFGYNYTTRVHEMPEIELHLDQDRPHSWEKIRYLRYHLPNDDYILIMVGEDSARGPERLYEIIIEYMKLFQA